MSRHEALENALKQTHPDTQTIIQLFDPIASEKAINSEAMGRCWHVIDFACQQFMANINDPNKKAALD